MELYILVIYICNKEIIPTHVSLIRVVNVEEQVSKLQDANDKKKSAASYIRRDISNWKSAMQPRRNYNVIKK